MLLDYGLDIVGEKIVSDLLQLKSKFARVSVLCTKAAVHLFICLGNLLNPKLYGLSLS